MNEFIKLHNLILKEKPQTVDAIIWLQGDRYDRELTVIQLFRDGWSDKIIISGNNILIGEKIKPGENNISLNEMKDRLSKNGIPHYSIIVDDGAMNTKEQAEHIFKITEKRKWLKLILVGSSYYQPRAFLTFLKQAKKTQWNGTIINQPAFVAWDQQPSGRNETTEIIFKQEFEKISKYKHDLVSVAFGIKYLSDHLLKNN